MNKFERFCKILNLMNENERKRKTQINQIYQNAKNQEINANERTVFENEKHY